MGSLLPRDWEQSACVMIAAIAWPVGKWGVPLALPVEKSASNGVWLCVDRSSSSIMLSLYLPLLPSPHLEPNLSNVQNSTPIGNSDSGGLGLCFSSTFQLSTPVKAHCFFISVLYTSPYSFRGFIAADILELFRCLSGGNKWILCICFGSSRASQSSLQRQTLLALSCFFILFLAFRNPSSEAHIGHV